ncbi:RimK family alpha-L-glutamate ligase [Candidatus Woesearchaeota archaeon]|nr:RimK family alpha-L-glutamate ligase [Candidatus Woesearchaeota archaeon]
MKAAIISLGSKSSKWTFKAMQKYFDHVDDINIKDIEINLEPKESVVLVKGKPIEEYDCIFAKGSFRYNSLLRALTTLLHKKSYMPVRTSAFVTAQHKLLTQLKMDLENIPMPKTYLSSSTQAARNILEKINYPVIMKFPEGTHGKGVMFADSFASANSILDALTALRQPFLIQEYIDTGGVDIRAFVVGNKVVAAMKRKSAEGEKRSNVHAGGKGEAVVLDEKTKKIAVNTAKVIGAEICGIDLIEGSKGPLVLEVNLSPGLQGITAATKVDIADKIAKYLYDKTVERSKVENANGTKKILEDVGIEPSKQKDLITTVDFRGERMLLPELITKITEFDEKTDVEIKIEKDKLVIKKFKM